MPVEHDFTCQRLQHTLPPCRMAGLTHCSVLQLLALVSSYVSLLCIQFPTSFSSTGSTGSASFHCIQLLLHVLWLCISVGMEVVDSTLLVVPHVEDRAYSMTSAWGHSRPLGFLVSMTICSNVVCTQQLIGTAHRPEHRAHNHALPEDQQALKQVSETCEGQTCEYLSSGHGLPCLLECL